MFFSNWFKPKELPETELEKEYMLLHDILGTMRRIGISASRIGSIAGGHKPIYEYNLVTSHIPFATLGAILNKAAIVDSTKINMMNLGKIEVKEEDVPITRCTWEELSKAVDMLEAANEIKKEVSGGGMLYFETKDVQLTKEGAYSFNTRKYQILWNAERDKRSVNNSTISTNFWMKRFTAVVAGSAFFTLVLQVVQLYYTINTTQKTTPPQETEKTTTLKAFRPDRTDTSLPAKTLVNDSIRQRK